MPKCLHFICFDHKIITLLLDYKFIEIDIDNDAPEGKSINIFTRPVKH